MPLPSRGCQNCRRQRVKCDETRPACEQCTKLHLPCPGFDTEKGSLFFRNENRYASGTRRKPRKNIKQCPVLGRISVYDRLVDDEVLSLSSPRSSDTASQHDIRSYQLVHGLTGISRLLEVPLEEQALAYFAKSHLDPSVPECFWSHLQEQLPQLDISNSISILGSATAALSLAVFSRSRSIPVALAASQHKYVQALARAKEAIEDKVEATSDQFLLAVQLLCSYENTLGHCEQNILHSSGYRHDRGTLAIMKARREARSLAMRNLRLDKNVRRQMIRTSILQGTRIPAWLHDGADFGEEGLELDLDSCFIEVSSIRCDAIDFWEQVAESQDAAREALAANATLLVQRCQVLDQRLANWASDLPPEWEFATQTLADQSAWNNRSRHDDTSFNGTVHIYPTLAQAVIWNRYRATRLICNSIVLKAYSFFPTALGSTYGEYLNDLQVAESKTKVLVDDICASIPFHFGRTEGSSRPRRVSSFGKETETATETTSARAAFVLVWPLLISSSAWGVPDHQRRWLKDQLMRVGRITASGVLQSLAS